MKWWVFSLLAALAAVPCQAEIYKWRLPNGSIEYSDRPPEKGAERVDLPPLTIYTPPATSPPGAPTTADSAAPFNGYESFAIASPADNATVRDNAGNVRLRFAVTPALVEGHAIEVFLDGQRSGRVGVPLLTLANVSRGFHEIHATIVDDGGAELARTRAIGIDVLRVSDVLSDEEKRPQDETPFDIPFRFETSGGPVPEDPENPGRASGGPVYIDPASKDEGTLRESGGAAYPDPEDPGRRRRSGGAESPGGAKTLQPGVRPNFGATPSRPPSPAPAPSTP
jgi:hypothetical protein